MTINFGVLPARVSFTLASDVDFYQGLKTSDASNFPATATIVLKWYNAVDAVVATWSATIVGATATFNQDKATVVSLLALLPVQGRVIYDDGAGGPELLIAQGVIRDISP